ERERGAFAGPMAGGAVVEDDGCDVFRERDLGRGAFGGAAGAGGKSHDCNGGEKPRAAHANSPDSSENFPLGSFVTGYLIRRGEFRQPWFLACRFAFAGAPANAKRQARGAKHDSASLRAAFHNTMT